MVHYFQTPVSPLDLPEKFTYPFHYTPHPLCIRASEEVKQYISTRPEWTTELLKGKMFGVLIIETPQKEIGFLAAFSGHLDGTNTHDYFVPPVYDLLKPEGFFKLEEEQISLINQNIHQLETASDLIKQREQLCNDQIRFKQVMDQLKEQSKQAKKNRDEQRKTGLTDSEESFLIRESQFLKAEQKRTEKFWKERIQAQIDQIAEQTAIISKLKLERKQRSFALQQRLFSQFRFLNARGDRNDLCAIFEQTVQKTPPSGAGECAAPKLLQYAYENELRPIAMAEFWWGNSPKTEIRKHGIYYPSCQGKCGPILGHMLQGLDVEDNPLSRISTKEVDLEIVYEDEWIVILNKPAGLLSVPGKSAHLPSALEFLQTRYPDATGPLLVHRLDMATSGLLLAAKSKEVHQKLQAQFKNRTIKKRYMALLDGVIAQQEGTITLPLSSDPLNRPRQIVDKEQGKPAITKYRVLDRLNGKTRVLFQPLTGRTHQLRVHAAHQEGLYCPIIGDELYGEKGERLFLHAESLSFIHPITQERINVEKKADFELFH